MSPAKPKRITTSEGHTYTMATATAFEIPETEAKELLSRGGRKAKPSVFEEDVKLASANPGKMYGIKPRTDDEKFSSIHSQLRIAAKALGVKLKIVNRIDTLGYVGFTVVAPVEETES